MTITLKAVVTPAQGDTLDGVELLVYTFTYAGAAQLVGTGKPDTKGAVLIAFAFTPGTYQPRLQLRMRRSTTATPIELSEDPKTFLNEVVDFGTLQLPPITPPPVVVTPPPVAETSLQNMLQETGLQVRQAQDTLRASGLQVGKVSLQLKVLPGTATGNVVVPKMEDLIRVNRRSLSQLSFEVDTISRTATVEVPDKPLPNLMNLTEVLASRKLAELQLQMEIVYLLVDSDEHVGRVRLQRPAAKTAVKPGSVVTLGIGKKG